MSTCTTTETTTAEYDDEGLLVRQVVSTVETVERESAYIVTTTETVEEINHGTDPS